MAFIDGDQAISSIAVAVDKDKNSSYAVKWAIDHLLISNPSLILIHVKIRNLQHQISGVNGASADGNGGLSDADLQQITFNPYRAYCARKGITIKEVILEDTDVSRALSDYISCNCITSIVVGASTRNALSWKFWNHDVPTTLNKYAPDFCSVYVITRGKALSVRPAARPAPTTTPRLPSPQGLPHHLPPDPSELEVGARAQSMKGGLKNGGQERMRPRNSPTNLSSSNINLQIRGERNSSNRNSLTDDSDFLAPLDLGSIDITGQNLDFTKVSNSSQIATPTSSSVNENSI